jgi:hypothetical protein
MTSPTSGGRSVGVVRSRTQTMEFFFFTETEAQVLTIVDTTLQKKFQQDASRLKLYTSNLNQH